MTRGRRRRDRSTGRTTNSRPLVTAILVWLALGSTTLAQERTLLVGVETERDRFTYHFTNPSSFDTAMLVPHFFEQRYAADNIWAVATLRYLAGIRWETSGGATAEHEATGDDYDTFLQPDGTVVVVGTTGGVRMQSWRLGQRGEVGHVGPVRFSAGYRFRLDRSEFELGHKTVTRNGALADASDVTTRETTSSQMHQVLIAVTGSRAVRSRWRVTIGGDLAPTTVGRLLVQLPDKYPERDLVFIAKVLGGTARVSAVSNGRWPLEVSVEGGRTWSYRSADGLSRDSISVRISVGR